MNCFWNVTLYVYANFKMITLNFTAPSNSLNSYALWKKWHLFAHFAWVPHHLLQIANICNSLSRQCNGEYSALGFSVSIQLGHSPSPNPNHSIIRNNAVKPLSNGYFGTMYRNCLLSKCIKFGGFSLSIVERFITVSLL